MEGPVIVLIVFGSVFAALYVYLSTRNKERLALIEKGADAKLFKTGGGKNGISLTVLNIALLAIGIGVGVLFGNLLEIAGMDDEIAMTSMVFIGGGLGLLGGFFASRKFAEKE